MKSFDAWEWFMLLSEPVYPYLVAGMFILALAMAGWGFWRER